MQIKKFQLGAAIMRKMLPKLCDIFVSIQAYVCVCLYLSYQSFVFHLSAGDVLRGLGFRLSFSFLASRNIPLAKYPKIKVRQLLLLLHKAKNLKENQIKIRLKRFRLRNFSKLILNLKEYIYILFNY